MNARGAWPDAGLTKEQPLGSLLTVDFQVVANRAISNSVFPQVPPADFGPLGFVNTFVEQGLYQFNPALPCFVVFFINSGPINLSTYSLLIIKMKLYHGG